MIESVGGLVPLAYVGIGGRGPEDVVADDRGRVLTGVEDGRILRVSGVADPVRARVEVLAETGGRPLGLELLPDGDLVVCDARMGLLRVATATGTVRVLADSVAGQPLVCCSNAVALSDGTVCFTASTTRYPLEHWLGDLVEHSGTGRLLRLAPGDDTPEVLLDGLQYANGLAVSGDESFLAVAETGSRRLTRYWLTGPDAGRSEAWLEDLPGAPDNIWRDPDGLMWVALAGPRLPALDAVHRAAPAVRRAAARAAVHVTYRPGEFAGALAVGEDGRIVHGLVRRRSGFRMTTSVCRAGDRLVMGSVWERGVAVYEAPGEHGDG